MKMHDLKKKGAITLEQIVPITVTLVIVAIILGVGADVLTQVQSGQCASGYTWNATSSTCVNGSKVPTPGAYTHAFNATHNGLQGLDELGGFQDTWGIIIALAVIIGILGFLYTR